MILLVDFPSSCLEVRSYALVYFGRWLLDADVGLVVIGSVCFSHALVSAEFVFCEIVVSAYVFVVVVSSSLCSARMVSVSAYSGSLETCVGVSSLLWSLSFLFWF